MCCALCPEKKLSVQFRVGADVKILQHMQPFACACSDTCVVQQNDHVVPCQAVVWF